MSTDLENLASDETRQVIAASLSHAIPWADKVEIVGPMKTDLRFDSLSFKVVAWRDVDLNYYRVIREGAGRELRRALRPFDREPIPEVPDWSREDD